ncbi:MAG: hypothetical protein KDJ65_25455 [Anaerolineae bacterium]|nr:hypothetical protein [Anaerolineae bacterium]
MWATVNGYSINLNKVNALSVYSKYGEYAHNHDKICHYLHILLDGGELDVEFETEEQCHAEANKIKVEVGKISAEK